MSDLRLTILAAGFVCLAVTELSAADPPRVRLQASGTVTREKRIPGVQEAKGDCRKILQGGYMKFDLSEYPAGAEARSAELRILLKSWSGNRWRWVGLLPTDPAAGDREKVFQEIEKHEVLLSGVVTLKKEDAGKWLSIRMNTKALQAINARLAEKSAEDRWIAMSLGFE